MVWREIFRLSPKNRKIMFVNARLKSILPGLAVTLLVALAAALAEHGERILFGRGWVESLVFAIAGRH